MCSWLLLAFCWLWEVTMPWHQSRYIIIWFLFTIQCLGSYSILLAKFTDWPPTKWKIMWQQRFKINLQNVVEVFENYLALQFFKLHLSYLKFVRDMFAITLKIGIAKFCLGLVNICDLHQSLPLSKNIGCESVKLVSNGFEEMLHGSTLDIPFLLT